MDVLGIDVGGSRIKGAIVDIETGLLQSDFLQIETPQPATPFAVAKAVNRLVETVTWKGLIGCGFPAVIQSGTATTAANIDTSWVGCHVKGLLERETGCICEIINDADAAGLAEVTFGAGKGRSDSVLMLTLGTGIGSAIFYRGQLFPNLELGHLNIAGFPAETMTSAAARVDEGLSWMEWSERLNVFFGEVERLLSPQLLILGGGVSEQAQQFFPYLTTQGELVAAQMLNRAGIVGAALFAASCC